MHDRLEKKVVEFIRLHGIFADAGDILIAVSGGADSIALLHLLKSLLDGGCLSGRLVCGHINHQLRGQASDADEQFVVEQAHRLGLPVVTAAVDVRSHAETHRLSIETAARQLRLAALAEIAGKQGCSWIAAGHQKNDNAETVLHRLRRGTGFRGLAGIRPMRQLAEALWVARPLLNTTRDEILQYIHERNLSWREDQTNADVAYTRNHIRHRLLPQLQRESIGSLVEDLSQLALSAGRLHDRVQQAADSAWTAMVHAKADGIWMEDSQLASLPEWTAIELIRRALVHLGCGQRDLTERHYAGILHLARHDACGKGISLPGGFEARSDGGRIVLHKACPLDLSRDGEGPRNTLHTLTIPGRTQFGVYEIDAAIVERDQVAVTKIPGNNGLFTEHLDWDRISLPVVVRLRQPGDRFQPLGLDGVKKVGKFLSTAKATPALRDQTLIFADREKILWVCPFRMAEPVKITDATRRILHLTVTDHSQGLRP